MLYLNELLNVFTVLTDDEELGEEDAKELKDAEELVKKLMEENKVQLEKEEREEKAGHDGDNGPPKKFETIAESHRWLGW